MSYSLAISHTDTKFSDYLLGSVTCTPSKKPCRSSFVPNYDIDELNEQLQLVQKFNELVHEWHDETIDLSSMTEILSHKAYLSIIGLGRPAIPLIFSELKRSPDYWFTALASILSANDEYTNPVNDEDRGDLEKMTEAWLAWGKEADYLD